MYCIQIQTTMKCPNYMTKLLLTVSHDSERSQDKRSLVIVVNIVT